MVSKYFSYIDFFPRPGLNNIEKAFHFLDIQLPHCIGDPVQCLQRNKCEESAFSRRRRKLEPVWMRAPNSGRLAGLNTNDVVASSSVFVQKETASKQGARTRAEKRRRGVAHDEKFQAAEVSKPGGW